MGYGREGGVGRRRFGVGENVFCEIGGVLEVDFWEKGVVVLVNGVCFTFLEWIGCGKRWRIFNLLNMVNFVIK